jgi:uncharacterized membrane protein YfcA
MEQSVLFLLIPVVFATAALSATIGLGGGVTLLAVMAVLLPPPLVVPLHGVIQLVSNGTRAAVYFPHVHWRIFAVYIFPAVIGVAVGSRWYVASPLPWFRPLVGVFILFYLLTRVWKPKVANMPLAGFAVLGAVTGLAASLIGATGPLLAPFFLRDDMTKENVVATKAAVQITTHMAKIPAFFAMGFVYQAHLWSLLPLCLAAVGGTFLGKKFLSGLEGPTFTRLFTGALVLVALNLILRG